MYYEAIHVFYFRWRGEIFVFEFVHKIIEFFLFSLSFTYRENSEIKVTVKLTGSTVEYIIVNVQSECNNVRTVFSEIFVVVLISDVTFITKFKKLNNWRYTVMKISGNTVSGRAAK